MENPVDKIIAKAEQIGVPVTVTEPSEKTEWLYTEPDERVPKQLRELMIAAAITEDDVEWAVSEKGYFPKGMRIWEYPADFINGVLVGAWDQVSRMILDRGPKE